MIDDLRTRLRAYRPHLKGAALVVVLWACWSAHGLIQEHRILWGLLQPGSSIEQAINAAHALEERTKGLDEFLQKDGQARTAEKQARERTDEAVKALTAGLAQCQGDADRVEAALKRMHDDEDVLGLHSQAIQRLNDAVGIH